MTVKNRTGRLQNVGRKSRTVMMIAALLAMYSSVDAFEVPTGNDDLVIHWDNTLRYTLAQRVKGQNSALVNSPNHNDGDINFNSGLVSSRLDLLTEADAVYKKDFGIRLSAAAWYDPIYRMSLDGKNPTPNTIVNGAASQSLNAYTKGRFGGPDAELLDAFAFAKFDLGEMPLSVRAGRHTIYWGEAFYPAAGSNAISYGQSPLDFAKALAMPGVELKEIFRPLNQVSFQIQPTKTITIGGQYYLQWESNIFPESGSYLGMVDGLMNSGQSYYFPWPTPLSTLPGFAVNSGDHTPKQARDWGVMARWTPEELGGGSVGIYYRNFSDKMPQVLSSKFLNPPGAPAFVQLPQDFYYDYKSNISLYGLSFSKQLMGISIGSELSYRTNMPLTSQWFAPAGARGETMHAVVNFLSFLPKTPLFDTGTALLEFAYGRWNKVTDNAQYFTGNDHGQNVVGGPTNLGTGHATRDNSTVTLNLVPEWKQVFSSVDMAMPMNFSMGMHGNAATLTGGTRGTGSFSTGISFDILAKYKVDLTYASFFGNVYSGNGGIVPPGFEDPSDPTRGAGAADAIALLRDRDLLSLTLKASF